jgi:hypothetical protein
MHQPWHFRSKVIVQKKRYLCEKYISWATLHALALQEDLHCQRDLNLGDTLQRAPQMSWGNIDQSLVKSHLPFQPMRAQTYSGSSNAVNYSTGLIFLWPFDGRSHNSAALLL